MPGATVRVTEKGHRILRDMSAKQSRPMQAVLDEALRQYEERILLDDLNAYYAELRADPQAWSEELRERAEWDSTLADGLEPDDLSSAARSSADA